jgi:predicted  nucleic acid-binding Zn-ribbon protein
MTGGADAATARTSGPQGVERLLRLQEIDLKLDRLSARRDQIEGGEDVRAVRERLAAAEVLLGDLRLTIDATAREQRRLEGDVEGLTRKRRDEERRLYDGTVANPKELQAIRAEVDGLAARTSRLEDRLLELMEELEGQEARLGPLERDAAEARSAVEDLLHTDADELEGIERDVGHLQRDRQALLPAFDPSLLTLYEDLRRQKKGVGAAALKDGVCQGCHQKLSPMELDHMKRAGGVWRCDNCRRILVPS